MVVPCRRTRSAEHRWYSYQVCRENGHRPGAEVLASDPPWNVCVYCGTKYRVRNVLEELDPPTMEQSVEWIDQPETD